LLIVVLCEPRRLIVKQEFLTAVNHDGIEDQSEASSRLSNLETVSAEDAEREHQEGKIADRKWRA
jgi:hypothetical protein